MSSAPSLSLNSLLPDSEGMLPPGRGAPQGAFQSLPQSVSTAASQELLQRRRCNSLLFLATIGQFAISSRESSSARVSKTCKRSKDPGGMRKALPSSDTSWQRHLHSLLE